METFSCQLGESFVDTEIKTVEEIIPEDTEENDQIDDDIDDTDDDDKACHSTEINYYKLCKKSYISRSYTIQKLFLKIKYINNSNSNIGELKKLYHVRGQYLYSRAKPRSITLCIIQ